MVGTWMVDEDYETLLEEHSIWSKKWKHNTHLEAEAMIVLDLMKAVARNIKNKWRHIKKCLERKIVWEMLAALRFKASQCTIDGCHTKIKIIGLKTGSKVKVDHASIKIINKFEEIDNNKKNDKIIVRCEIKRRKGKMWRKL